jgi:hypothetical protein
MFADTFILCNLKFLVQAAPEGAGAVTEAAGEEEAAGAAAPLREAGAAEAEVETEAAPAFEEKAARELAEAEARAAAEDARRAAQLAAQLEAESRRLALEESRASALAAKAQERAKAAAASVGGLSSKAKELGGFGSFVSKLGTVKGGEPRESRRAKSDAELASVSAAVESASQQSVPKPSPNIPAE